jgi:hypothetical protein
MSRVLLLGNVIKGFDWQSINSLKEALSSNLESKEAGTQGYPSYEGEMLPGTRFEIVISAAVTACLY